VLIIALLGICLSKPAHPNLSSNSYNSASFCFSLVTVDRPLAPAESSSSPRYYARSNSSIRGDRSQFRAFARVSPRNRELLSSSYLEMKDDSPRDARPQVQAKAKKACRITIDDPVCMRGLITIREAIMTRVKTIPQERTTHRVHRPEQRTAANA